MPHDVVTFGEAMLRFVPQQDLRTEQAQAFNVTVGGGELNVAVCVSRLGFSSAWVSRLPDNALGRLLLGKVREQNVDASHVALTKDGRCGLYFLEQGASPRAAAVLYDRAGSSISLIKPGDVNWAKVFDGVKRFHISGITPALSKSAADTTLEALKAGKAAGVAVSYDLNYRSKLWTPAEARACQEPLMQYVDLLITTEEDTKVVFGIEAPKIADEKFTTVETAGYRDVAMQLAHKFGFKGVAITLRQNRSVWFNDWWGLYYDAPSKNFFEAPKFQLEIVDRVGAGDSFAGGLLSALLIKPNDFDHAIRFAVAASALKHTLPGDFAIISRGEVESLMKGGGLRIVR
ncbi:MAG TPA: sugar kinase [Planctomycetota bacterium]|nr:sugar kinase [Planctomycetota bacterium]